MVEVSRKQHCCKFFYELRKVNDSLFFLVSFLFVCVIYAVLIGIPLCCLEMFLGQLSGVGIGKTFGLMSPVFQGTVHHCLQYTV